MHVSTRIGDGDNPTTRWLFEVARRWWRLFPGRRDEQGQPAEPTEAELNPLMYDGGRLEQLRKRLASSLRAAAEKAEKRWFHAHLSGRLSRPSQPTASRHSELKP